jgi:hypothetical protein
VHIQRDVVRASHGCLLAELETAYPIYGPALLTASVKLATSFLSEFRRLSAKLTQDGDLNSLLVMG